MFAAALLAVVGSLSCAGQPASRLEGTWDLIETRSTPPDPNFNFAEWHQIKILTSTHWVYLSQKRMAPTMTSFANDTELLAAAKTFGAGGGTYTLDGDTYTEHIDFFSTPNYVGKSIPWKIRWEGDEWIQTGTFPVKALGLGDQDIELSERYRRVK
jgi:hypothetical protein